jgi:hypothetical protein
MQGLGGDNMVSGMVNVRQGIGSQVGEYLGEVGEYWGDVGEYWGEVGEYWGEVGE